MSDYLNNIVARSLGVADVVQPRLPQLFEYSGHRVGVPPEGTLGIPLEQDVALSSNEATHPRSIPAKRLLTGTGVEPTKPPLATTTPSVPVSLLPAVRKNQPSIAVERTAIKSDARGEQVFAPAAEAARTHAQPEDLALQPKEPLVAKRVSEGAVKDPAPTSPTISQPMRQPAVVSLPTANGNLEQSPAVVKVTIGRVDVRAIFPPASPSRAAPTRPKPALSLESYLKEREQGKR